MKNETMLIIGGIGIIGASYIGYLHNKVNKISKMFDVTVDNLSSGIDVQISNEVVESAVDRAVERSADYAAREVVRNLNAEIRSQVERKVYVNSTEIKESVGKEIARQVKNIDISDIEREVVNKAKDAVVEKFDRKLDGLLDEFNDNLQNVQKIYSSIAKSMAKE